MKKIIVILMLTILYGLWGGVEVEFEGDRVTIQGDFRISEIKNVSISDNNYVRVEIEECKNGGRPGEVVIPHFTKLLNLPETGNWEVVNLSYETEEFELTDKLLHNGAEENPASEIREIWYPQQLVQISDPVIMRNQRFSQVSIKAMQYNKAENKIRILKNIQLELEIVEDQINPKTRSALSQGESFSKIARTQILGSGSRESAERGKYLFIVPNNVNLISTMNYLVSWKRKLGHQVEMVTLDETGDTSDQIKNYLQNAYDNWDIPPEYVLLAGDINGIYTLPSWYIDGYLEPYCVTDHPYTLLEGIDYFPDIQIGRLSVQTLNQLQTIVTKIINYESDPADYNDWTRRALMLAYVVDYGYNNMTSQRETVMQVREKLLDFTYTEVDTFIAPDQSGSSNLVNLINTGYSFINYRGAGSPVYWSGGWDHMLTLWDLGDLSNGFMLPMVTSIVCGGGNFAYGNYDTCFGEQWLAAGTPTNPKGAIGFIGPSEHDTKTPFNNCNDMGIYQGITQEGIFGSAPMMLRGKMELYANYPGCHSMDGVNDAWDSDMFYFYVYNLLGDPGLEVWTDVPKTFNCDLADMISEGSSYYTVQLTGENLADKVVALTAEDELYNVAYTDENGWAAVEIPAELSEFEVTVSGYGYIPETVEVSVSDTEQVLSLSGYDFTIDPAVGTICEIILEINNGIGETQYGVEIEVISNDEQVEIESGIQMIEELEGDEMVELSFTLEFAEEWREKQSSILEIQINNGELGKHYVFYDVSTPQIGFAGATVQNSQNCVMPGEENELVLSLYNGGDEESGEFILILDSKDNKCEIFNGDCVFGSIDPGETEMGSGALIIEPSEDLITGEPLDFRMILVKDNDVVWESDFTLEVGEVSIESPTFSSYGYYAIESRDNGNFATPLYEWFELSIEEGGPGTELPTGHSTSDGFSTCIPLPFEFCYYGKFYDKITVSSNGWLAMGDEEYVFFRNRIIPSGAGPKAMIAPFWDFITDGEIYTYHDEGSHKFYIEWYEFEDDFSHQDQTFQVILYDPAYHLTNTGDGEIEFQYKEIHNVDQAENYATIGIENETQTEGLLLSYADYNPLTMHQIESETAILITIKEGISVPRLIADTEEILISLEPDSLESYDFNLNNISEDYEVSYEIGISHFPEVYRGRDLGNSSLNPVNQTYYTGYGMNLYAFMVHDEEDEAVHGIEMNFPDNVEVLSATDIGDLHYNGETGYGAAITWGYGNGEDYSGSIPQTFHVYFIVDEGVTSPLPIDWRIDGDGSGTMPHSVDGVMTLMPSDDTYLWVEYPNGGEELAYGVEDTIRWTYYGDIDEVDIYFTENNFINYEVIAESVTNSGEYVWNVPWEITDTAKIRVRDANGNEYDNSDNCFSIRALVITYPTGETVIEYGSQEEINWNFAGIASMIDIDYSVTGGYNWSALAESVPNTGSYQFIVNMPPSDNCKVRITAIGESCIVSEMEDEFSVVDVPVDWLENMEMTGVVEPGGMSNVQFDVNTIGMGAGTYTAYITIRTDYNQTISIPVHLEVINLASDPAELPPVGLLMGNYPNPFITRGQRGSNTKIDYQIAGNGKIKLSIYNLRGQLIMDLVDENQAAGNYSYSWDGNNRRGKPAAAGIYFYQLEIDGKMVATKKCLLLK